MAVTHSTGCWQLRYFMIIEKSLWLTGWPCQFPIASACRHVFVSFYTQEHVLTPIILTLTTINYGHRHIVISCYMPMTMVGLDWVSVPNNRMDWESEQEKFRLQSEALEWENVRQIAGTLTSVLYFYYWIDSSFLSCLFNYTHSVTLIWGWQVCRYIM